MTLMRESEKYDAMRGAHWSIYIRSGRGMLFSPLSPFSFPSLLLEEKRRRTRLRISVAGRVHAGDVCAEKTRTQAFLSFSPFSFLLALFFL